MKLLIEGHYLIKNRNKNSMKVVNQNIDFYKLRDLKPLYQYSKIQRRQNKINKKFKKNNYKLRDRII